MQAVRRVIAAMRERYADAWSLEEMSEIAISSPFHFNRVFREVTGLPPARFLSAIRLQVAKQLLLTTRRTVTDICFRVGYNSLGTFTAHFAEHVGAPPSHFRRLSRSMCPLDFVRPDVTSPNVTAVEVGSIHGVAYAAAPENRGDLAIIGLFPGPLPRGQPAACTIAAVGSSFRLGRVTPGWYHLFSVAINAAVDDLSLHLGESMPRAHLGPLLVRYGSSVGPLELELRPPRDTDPPLLVALPLLMSQSGAAGSLTEHVTAASSTASAVSVALLT